jgi:membrane fusion protein (multidrug efflux system)
MADSTSLISSRRFRAIVGAALLIVAGVGIWLFVTRGRESTDDAQVDGHVTQMAARVGGTVLNVAIKDHQAVKAGDVLVAIDPRDYQIALDKARAELADAEASALAAQSNIPITSTTASSNVATAQGSVEQARGAVAATEKEVEAARARLTAAQAREREAQANATRAARDVDRLKGLLAKDEVSQQQHDSAVAAADASRAAVDSVRAQVVEAEAAIRVAESRLAQARAGEQQAASALRSAQTVPEQVTATRARAASAQARVEQAKATLAQAELNLQYTTVKAPTDGIVARKSVNPGQVIQAGQPLCAIVQIDDVWVTANFKETQLADMRPGQRAVVEVDAYGGRKFEGKVESIAAATGARFSLLPPENATGNFVKVVQRVPVKIVLDGEQNAEFLLRPGMSVTPTVYTR